MKKGAKRGQKGGSEKSGVKNVKKVQKIMKIKGLGRCNVHNSCKYNSRIT